MKAVCVRSWRVLGAAVAAGAWAVGVASGQSVRLEAQREVEPPDYATFKLGPFFSSVSWSESVGYRYTTSSGEGTDYLIDNERGEIKEDGSDIPVISSLTFRNYLILGPHADLDASFTVSYEWYPMDTQDDEFNFDMVEEGVYGTLSSEFRLTPFLYGSLYDSIVYRTDYVDTRGLEDNNGGEAYEYLHNTIGTRLNWLMARDDALTLSLSRGDWWSYSDGFDDQERTEYNETLTYTHTVWEGLDTGAEASAEQFYYVEDTRPDTTIENLLGFARIGKGAGAEWMSHSSLEVHAGYAWGSGAEGEGVERDLSTPTYGVSLDTDLRKDLSHRLRYAHSLQDGFDTAFEEYDDFSYHLKWVGDISTAAFRSIYRAVTVSSDASTDYADWENGITLTRALTKRVTVTLDSSYTVRDNEEAPADNDLDVEDVNDYDTWDTEFSTGFEITKRTTFTTAYQYVERFSDEPQLEYSRHWIEAFLTYRRQF